MSAVIDYDTQDEAS